MSFISISEYDLRERAARARASYPAIRAFSPLAFAHVNFPTRVSEEGELRRYADIMYETLPIQEWMEAKRYNEDEAEAIRRLADQIYQITGELFERPVQALMCLFPPIPIVRVIERIAQARRSRLNVFEIGPGSGYLGAYVLNLGHRYAAMDNCQSLYLWQNRLFGKLCTHYRECALEEDPSGAANLFAFQGTHVPWWHFSRWHESEPGAADIFVCDAALGEMDIFAREYILRIARRMIGNSGTFLFQNLGEERFTQRAQLEMRLAGLGLRLFNFGGVTICSERDLGDLFSALDAAHLGSGRKKLSPSEFLTIKTDNLLESYHFFEFIGFGKRPIRR